MRERIIILGGGMASMAAAMALTSRPELRARYAVTVVQEGWLLGGKGASVRNRGASMRIEEHGLHLWLGFYENAFALMRETYAELGRRPGQPLASFDEAFAPYDEIALMERTPQGFARWPFHPPRNRLRPGLGGEHPTIWGYLRRGLSLVTAHLRVLDAEARAAGAPARARGLVVPLVAALLAVRQSARVADELAAPALLRNTLLGPLEAALRQVWQRAAPHVDGDPWVRRAFTCIEFFVVNALGLAREGLLDPRLDFSALDDMEYRTWLKKHGASDMTIHSALTRAIYNLAFTGVDLPDGGAAGTVLVGSMRAFLAYRGSMFYRMSAGMGETVFAPMYEVLRRRGVAFKFLHRVTGLRLDAEGKCVGAVELERQARVVGDGEYAPLIDVGGLPCWPEAPLWEQLEDGKELARRWSAGDRRLAGEAVRLEHGRDFDRAILGISIAALPAIAGELIAADPRWQAMVAAVRTIKTVAMQLWMKPGLRGLGHRGPPPIVGTYAEPYETWTDMSHLLQHEQWGAGGPRTLAYLCGTLDDGAASAEIDGEPGAETRAQALTETWLEDHARGLWPEFAEAAVHAKYVRANTRATDRYVLSVPGSTRHRLWPDQSGFANLLLAGDWTRTGLDAGCIEAATMSGLMAARAICGEPARIVGEIRRAPTVTARATPRTGRELPAYVERLDEVVMRQPYLLDRTWLHALVFRADGEKLAALLERRLNRPTGGKLCYRPAAPFVVLVAAASQEARSADPDHGERGHMPEIDIAFWVPCRPAHERLPRLCWHMPYVFVDSAAAMNAGREIYGFPKSLAAVTLEGAGERLDLLDVRSAVIPRFGRTSAVEERSLLRVERVGEAGPASRLAGALAGMLPGRGIGRVDLVFLKQFRDAEQPDRACYQAIVEAPAEVRTLRAMGTSNGRYRAQWSEHASHPFVAELGLTAPQDEPVLATWCDFDFVMQRGREIWRVG